MMRNRPPSLASDKDSVPLSTQLKLIWSWIVLEVKPPHQVSTIKMVGTPMPSIKTSPIKTLPFTPYYKSKNARTESKARTTTQLSLINPVLK